MMNINFETPINTIIDLNEFNKFRNFIFPIQWGYPKNLKLKDIDRLLPYHTCLRKETTLDVINTIYEKTCTQKNFFIDIYSDDEKLLDYSKKETGLFFFKGDKNKPFAIICAGGGFSYVGSIQESFPHAIELSKKGYNAFVLHYRLGNANLACEDLARAIAYIFNHHNELEINLSSYSLWGGSAGARMAAYLGSYGTKVFINEYYPKPACVVMQYTGHSHFTDTDPATFACIGVNDRIASVQVMRNRINHLNNYGIPTQFKTYSNLGHGFGLGVNTTAEGWIEDAIHFWEQQMEEI